MIISKLLLLRHSSPYLLFGHHSLHLVAIPATCLTNFLRRFSVVSTTDILIADLLFSSSFTATICLRFQRATPRNADNGRDGRISDE